MVTLRLSRGRAGRAALEAEILVLRHLSLSRDAIRKLVDIALASLRP